MFRTLFFALATLFCACGQPTPPAAIQSPAPVQKFKTAESLKKYIAQRIDTPMNLAQFETAGAILDSLYPTIQASGFPEIESMYWRACGFIAARGNLHDSAQLFYHRAISKALEIDTTNRALLEAKSFLGKYFIHNRQMDSAFKYLLEVYDHRSRMDPELRPDICLSLGGIFHSTGDMQRMKAYLDEARHFAVLPGSKTRIFNNLATYFDRAGQKDSANFYQEKSVQAKGIVSPLVEAMHLESQSVVELRRGNVQKSEQLMLAAIEKARAGVGLQSGMYHSLAALYMDTEQYAKAAPYIDTANQLAHQGREVSQLKKNFLMLSAAYKHMHRPAAAYVAMDSALYYSQQNDTLALDEKAREIETRYAVKEKDQEIRQLAFANQVASQINRQRLIIIVSITAAAVLLGAVGMLLFRRRQTGMVIRQHQLQQQLLRSQMEPHFIGNVLANMKAIIMGDEKEKAMTYLQKFARLAQISLANARESYVPLSQEIEALESYLALQAMQYHRVFTYDIQVYDGLEDDNLLIPPMLLQPFVENALLHGLHSLEYAGAITVTIERDQNLLHCVIEDNGAGLGKRHTPTDKPSFSTIITQERLSLLSRETKQPATLRIVDLSAHQARGVRVELQLPVLQRRKGAAFRKLPH